MSMSSVVYESSRVTLVHGDALEVLKEQEEESAHMCVTSPPYWGLRDYGVDGQIGLEPTPEEWVEKMAEVFGEVRRVLREDGTLWLNVGDTYAASGRGGGGDSFQDKDVGRKISKSNQRRAAVEGYKPKDLVGIPWLLAFALRADGWWLRSDIIWCLSGGAKVYAQTQKGEMPMTVKDLVRLDPSTVKLWNGERWTQCLGWNKSPRPNDPIEIELRSGEKIGCTPKHLWPTQRGNIWASDLRPGDVIHRCRLPEPSEPHSPALIGQEVAWFLGIYLAEGSRDDRGRIQIASHADEAGQRIALIRPIAEAFGGTVRGYVGKGDAASIVVSCPPLAAIVDQYIRGRSAKTKGIKVRAWRHNNAWLSALLSGYLAGDGSDRGGGRWRLGFTRNDGLADDLRTIAARLGYTLTLRIATAEGFGQTWPIYRGEICLTRSGHHNEKDRSEIVKIGTSRARKFWHIGVEDEPHLFALASGILTHNSKPNPMPGSMKDRPTSSHEYLFLLTKSKKYYYDATAIAEPSVEPHRTRSDQVGGNKGAEVHHSPGGIYKQDGHGRQHAGFNKRYFDGTEKPPTRNRRDVWTIPTQPMKKAHFATFPEKLVDPCVLAGSPAGGTVLDPFCGSGTAGVVAVRHERRFLGIDLNREYLEEIAGPRIAREEAKDRPQNLFGGGG